MQQTFSSVLMILAGMYGIRLAFAHQLTYYIHPRYAIFTVIACVLLVGIGIVVFTLAPATKQTRRRSMRSFIQLLPLTIFVVAGMVLPARALSSASANQRTTTVIAPQQAPADSVSSGTVDVSTLDTSAWAFDDFWYSLMIQDQTLAHYEGKRANLLGFVTHPKSAPEGTFYLTRFLLMCCAIDAQPVGFWVKEDASAGTASLSNDTWLQVAGTLHVTPWQDKNTLVLSPESVQHAEQPTDPYVY